MNDGQSNTENGNIGTWRVRQADRATAAWLAVALAALTPALAHGETPAASVVPAAHAAANTGHKHAVLTYPGIRLSLPPPAATETAAEEAPIQSDVIDRIRDGFAMPHMERREIETQRNWYARHPDYMERVLLRSQRYLFWIVEEVERRGMPTELALLPIVESAFDPFAYSHGRAAGLWQIIPGTGKRFGLKQNWWYDGRRDPVASTRAALDYLEKLHADFDGDWLLAVAAYNSGEGNVMRAQRRNRKAGKPTDFWNLKLPVETEAYVPKLLALQQLIGDPQRFGLELPSVANQPYFAVVELSAQIDLALAAELAGIEMDELYALNAGFNRWATDPDGPMRIQVPVAASERFRRELAALPEGQQVRWVRYKIRSGDALSLIAKRHDTTADVLRQINDIRGNSIRAGDYLMIPTATRSLDNYSQSAAERLARLQNRPRGATKSVHVVRTGESLWTISQRYGVGTRSLAKWNGMAPGDTLSVGRELVVWSGKTASGNGNSAKVRKVHYTVRKGDSLARIAGKFRVTIGDLKNWNQSLAGKKYLQPGQRIVMYVDVTRQSGV
jgi:membrane-bound lytic murein transglycosylase D